MNKSYIENIFKGIDDDIRLDNEQKKVILDDSDNLMVIAGAGCGKSTTIAAKVKYLIDVKKIKPEEILIISLTNKAINELRSTINIKFNLNVDIFTFHKFAYNLLKKEDIRYKVCSNWEDIIKKLILKDKDTLNIMKALRKNKIYKRIDKRYLDGRELLFNITIDIIKLIKTLNIRLEQTYTNKITEIYSIYLKKIKEEYEKILDKDFKLDFEDIIIKAINLDYYDCNYKYIIVDEYQDISINRLNLLKKIASKTNAKTIVVGDDFQTIFSFAGSDIDLFLNYADVMKATVLKITNTYRNSQELIDVAGKFVMKNNYQIKKELQSRKRLNKPIRIYGYDNNFDCVFEKIINEIIDEFGINKNVLILGRYKKDIEFIKSNKFNIKDNKIIYLMNKNIDIEFMTIHASKGLGYNNVILINFSDEYMGFPSNIDNLFLKKEILGIDSDEEEERRLFYVALTRTKNRVYIITPIKNESRFIYELYNEPNVLIDYRLKIIKKNKKHKVN